VQLNFSGDDMTKPKTPKAQRSDLKVVAGTQTDTQKGGKAKTRYKTPLNSHGLTDKQESFAMAVFEGSNFSDAYRQAYDAGNMSAATIHTEACLLVQHPKVSLRLDQLHRDREQQRRMQSLSRSDLVLKQLTEIALSDEVQDGARVRALELLGKSVALFTDRVETEDTTDRTADEIERDLKAKLARLGIS
jgi:hypothetical protein